MAFRTYVNCTVSGLYFTVSTIWNASFTKFSHFNEFRNNIQNLLTVFSAINAYFSADSKRCDNWYKGEF